ncbi:MAG: hypothetical protein PHN89_00195 [Candidatus Pacebacteria bacterium]|nr:hypothetical protein [Candidatus Paceibacterota bacterium]
MPVRVVDAHFGQNAFFMLLGKGGRMHQLPTFPACDAVRWNDLAKRQALLSPRIRAVVSYALGPAGTNMEQVARLWHAHMGIENKAVIELCDLPETAVKRAIAMQEDGVLAVFWTCAVFARLHKVFFGNPATLPLFFVQQMALDEMQLAVRNLKYLSLIVEQGGTPNALSGIKIASHVSPAPLLDTLVANRATLVDAKSNAQAAEMCAVGEVEACMTTESARKLHRLTMVHVFGSPPMLFFGGITASGFKLLKSTQ